MSSPSPEEQLETLLHGAGVARRCTVCRIPELCKMLEHFFALKDAKDPRVLGITWHWLYTNKLRALHAGPSEVTVRKHVKECMKRDTSR